MGCLKLHNECNNDLRIINSDVDLFPKKNVKKTCIERQYKYNGKELQEELGLDWYDFHARNYDAALGRWMNIDPLSENSRRWTPYNFAYNNPIYFVDPDGMQATDWYQNSGGDYVYDSNLTAENAGSMLGEGETYIGESATINVTNGDNVSLNNDGSVTTGGQTYAAESGGAQMNFNFESGNSVYVGNGESGNAEAGASSPMIGPVGEAGATMTGTGAASKTLLPKKALSNVPGSRVIIPKGAKWYTSLESAVFNNKFTRPFAEALGGRMWGSNLAKAGNGFMIADAYYQYNQMLGTSNFQSIYNQNSANLSGFQQSLINSSEAAGGIPARPTHNASRRQSLWQRIFSSYNQNGNNLIPN